MKPGAFQSAVVQEQVVKAIAAAEQRTSGEIRVVVSRRAVEDPVAEASQEFERLGMTATRQRNAVLIFIAPKSQCFAVIGDEGVHQLCGETFWSDVAAATADHFRAGDFTGGLVLAIERAGALLATHFPRQPDDVDELPNAVVET
jgi:uncharacterized membrane protein